MIYQNQHKTKSLNSVKTAIYVGIVLGSPRKNCAGIGICRIERLDMMATKPAKVKCCCPAKAMLTTQGKNLIIFLLKHTITAAVYQRQFKAGLFQLPEPFVLTASLSDALGLAPRSTLQAGAYSVREVGSHLCITIPLEAATDERRNITSFPPMFKRELRRVS